MEVEFNSDMKTEKKEKDELTITFPRKLLHEAYEAGPCNTTNQAFMEELFLRVYEVSKSQSTIELNITDSNK